MSDFICPEGVVAISLSGRLGAGLSAIVDVADAKALGLAQMAWHSSNGYAAHNLRRRQAKGLYPLLLMHRLILNAPPELSVDHINGNKLDNRRSNLRLATHTENMQNRKMAKHNTCGFKGVWQRKRNGKTSYRAEIRCNGKRHTLGTFLTPNEAHEAYLKASRELHGKFSRHQ